MHSTFNSFNTAVIKYEDNFLALLLKLKQKDGTFPVFYMQFPVLVDFIHCLRNRLAFVKKRIEGDGEPYKEELIAAHASLIKDTPQIDMPELHQPDPSRRIASVTLKPGKDISTIIFMMQSEEIAILHIDDKHVDSLLTAIQLALVHAEEKEILNYLSMNMDYLILYAADLASSRNIDYQQFQLEEWKLNLFSHYLAVLYCYQTEEGKKIMSGAVVKTSVPHPSEAENHIVLSAIERSPKLKAFNEKFSLCQVFSRPIMAQQGKMLSLEECLRPLHAYFLEQQAALDS